MIGIDTNVLVRFLVADDPRQTKAVRAMFDRRATIGEPVHIDLVVLVETAWVLKSRYGVEREGLARVLDELLEDPWIDLQHEAAVAVASRDFHGSQHEFADLLIAAVNDLNGCSTTMTFDRRAARRAGMTLLAA